MSACSCPFCRCGERSPDQLAFDLTPRAHAQTDRSDHKEQDPDHDPIGSIDHLPDSLSVLALEGPLRSLWTDFGRQTGTHGGVRVDYRDVLFSAPGVRERAQALIRDTGGTAIPLQAIQQVRQQLQNGRRIRSLWGLLRYLCLQPPTRSGGTPQHGPVPATPRLPTPGPRLERLPAVALPPLPAGYKGGGR